MSWRLSLGELAARRGQTALQSSQSSLSYAELAERATEVGRALGDLDACPGQSVALISSGRAHDEAVGLAGILGAGAIVVPLDATAPPHRLAQIARGRGCRAIVLDQGALGIAEAMASLGTPLGKVVLDPEGRLVMAEGGLPADSSIEPQRHLACTLHTSGSTGTPKAVPITWEGLDAFTGWGIELLRMASSERVLRVAELTFDLAWFDHLAAWRVGATLCTMPRRDLAAGRSFDASLQALRPSIVYGVPSLFMKLSAAVPGDAPFATRPRAVLFAGEVFPPRELVAFARRLPETELYNFFGPTETNVCTFHRVDRAALDPEKELPIGRATPFASCRLVGEDGRDIEGAGIGELVVEGPTTVGGGPYATRDRVERGPDGLFYFRGRIDRMVKIRGYRVEPGEVEATLASHPAVRRAAVVVHDDPRLGKVLRAFVLVRSSNDEAEPSGRIDADERSLRLFLAERLPPYMVPDRIFALDELPLTSTGKVDYQALQSLASPDARKRPEAAP